MNAQAIAKEIADTGAYLRARGNLKDSSDAAVNLRRSLANQLAATIQNTTSFCPSDALTLASALGDKPYGEHTTTVQIAIDSRLAYSASAQGIHKSRAVLKTVPAHMYIPHKIHTRKDWAVISSNSINMHVKMSVVVSRLNKLGISHPHQRTIRHIVAMLVLVHYEKFPTFKEIYNLVQDFKSAVDAERKSSYPHPRPIHFPSSVEDLPQHILDFAYDVDDQPVTVECAGLEYTAMKLVPLRKNSKLLRGGDGSHTRMLLEELGRPHDGIRMPADMDMQAPGAASAMTTRVTATNVPAAEEVRDAPGELPPGLAHTPAMHGRPFLPEGARVSFGGVSWGGPAKYRKAEAAVGTEVASVPSKVPTTCVIGSQASVDGEVESEADEDEDSDDTADGSPTAAGSGDLNACAKAAIAALQNRDSARKLAKKPAANTLAASATELKKRPSCCQEGRPPLPIDSSEPVMYNGGKVWFRKHRFQVKLKYPQRNPEKMINWAGEKPAASEWSAALAAIDDYNKNNT